LAEVAGQVADAVGVGVLEGAGVDLVNNTFLPPVGHGDVLVIGY